MKILLKYPAITKPQDWLEIMAKQMGVNVVNDELKLPKHIGKGVFRQYYPFEWLTISYLRFTVNKPMEFRREGQVDKHLFPIVFYLDDSDQYIGGRQYRVGIHSSNGIFMPSPGISTKWIFPANQLIKSLTITFDKNWLIKEIANDNSYIYKLLVDGESFYLFESFTPAIFNLISNIEADMVSKVDFNRLHLYSDVLQLFNTFLDIVNDRKYEMIKSRINSYDIEKLFKVRKIVLDNVCSLPNVSYLAEEATMSVSKLQKKFKQVFGKSISQFALSEKMELAKNMLLTKQHTVSEVGYRLGYINLSHFSKAFRRHFKLNPKEFLDSLL